MTSIRHILGFGFNTYVEFDYTNWKGIKRRRMVALQCVDLITNEHYPNGAICLTGIDREKNAVRSFSIANIDYDSFQVISTHHLAWQIITEQERDRVKAETKVEDPQLDKICPTCRKVIKTPTWSNTTGCNCVPL